MYTINGLQTLNQDSFVYLIVCWYPNFPKHQIAKIVGQRDCSIQRKNQKIIEEIPSDFVDINNLKTLENNIENLLLSTNYEGVGTLEFLYQDNQIYFIEMNTRLQVEHPVTEEAYDLDLVKNQIMVAAGYQPEIDKRRWK